MDIDMMDVDISSNGGNHSCSRCGKQVCSRCAVSNLGMERKCLGCAGKGQQWMGGIGWLGQDRLDITDTGPYVHLECFCSLFAYYIWALGRI